MWCLNNAHIYPLGDGVGWGGEKHVMLLKDYQ